MSALTSVARRGFNYCRNTAHKGFHGCKKVTQRTFHNITLIKDDPDALTHLWKVASNVCLLLSVARAKLIHTPIGKAIAIVDATRLIVDFHDLVTGKFRNMSWKDRAQRIAFAVANVTFTAGWIIELGFVSATAATTVALGIISNVGVALGFGIGSAHAFWMLLKKHDCKHVKEIRIKAFLDFIAYTTAFALPVISLLGVSSPVGLGVLAIVASGFALASFVYSDKNSEKFAEVEADKGKKKHKEFKIPFVGGLYALVDESEGLDKVCKFITKVGGQIKHAGVKALAAQAKAFEELHETLNIFKRIKEWITPDKVVTTDKDGNRIVKRKCFWQKKITFFKAKDGNRTTSIWKIGNKIFLTTLAACKALEFSLRYQIVRCATISAAAIGAVPVLAAGALTSVIAFSGFSFVDNVVQMKSFIFRNWKYGNREYKVWRKRQRNLQDANVLADVEASRRKDAEKLRQDGVRDRQAEINKLNSMTPEEYCRWKLSKKKVTRHNGHVRWNKAFINVFNDISKVFGASFALAGLAIAFTASPVAISVVGAFATSFAISSAIIGLGKFWYEAQHKRPRKKPEMVAAAR